MTILAQQPAAPVVAKKSKPWDSFLANSRVPQGHTDELVTWLSKIQQKKISIRSTRHRDLRKEALLESSRVAAQSELEAMQRERMQRWKRVKSSLSPPSSPTHQDEGLCDCDSCFLCQRQGPLMYGKCYCNVIFSPRPVFMDFSYGPNTFSHGKTPGENMEEDQVSVEADNFLANLGKRRHTEEHPSRKRAKA